MVLDMVKDSVHVHLPAVVCWLGQQLAKNNAGYGYGFSQAQTQDQQRSVNPAYLFIVQQVGVVCMFVSMGGRVVVDTIFKMGCSFRFGSN